MGKKAHRAARSSSTVSAADGASVERAGSIRSRQQGVQQAGAMPIVVLTLGCLVLILFISLYIWSQTASNGRSASISRYTSNRLIVQRKQHPAADPGARTSASPASSMWAEDRELYHYTPTERQMITRRIQLKRGFVQAFITQHRPFLGRPNPDPLPAWHGLLELLNVDGVLQEAGNPSCTSGTTCLDKLHEAETWMDDWTAFNFGYDFRHYNAMKNKLLREQRTAFFMKNDMQEWMLLNKEFDQSILVTDKRPAVWRACKAAHCQVVTKPEIHNLQASMLDYIEAHGLEKNCRVLCQAYKWMDFRMYFPHQPSHAHFEDFITSIEPYCTANNEFCKHLVPSEDVYAALKGRWDAAHPPLKKTRMQQLNHWMTGDGSIFMVGVFLLLCLLPALYHSLPLRWRGVHSFRSQGALRALRVPLSSSSATSALAGAAQPGPASPWGGWSQVVQRVTRVIGAYFQKSSTEELRQLPVAGDGTSRRPGSRATSVASGASFASDGTLSTVLSGPSRSSGVETDQLRYRGARTEGRTATRSRGHPPRSPMRSPVRQPAEAAWHRAREPSMSGHQSTRSSQEFATADAATEAERIAQRTVWSARSRDQASLGSQASQHTTTTLSDGSKPAVLASEASGAQDRVPLVGPSSEMAAVPLAAAPVPADVAALWGSISSPQRQSGSVSSLIGSPGRLQAPSRTGSGASSELDTQTAVVAGSVSMLTLLDENLVALQAIRGAMRGSHSSTSDTGSDHVGKHPAATGSTTDGPAISDSQVPVTEVKMSSQESQNRSLTPFLGEDPHIHLFSASGGLLRGLEGEASTTARASGWSAGTTTTTSTDVADSTASPRNVSEPRTPPVGSQQQVYMQLSRGRSQMELSQECLQQSGQQTSHLDEPHGSAPQGLPPPPSTTQPLEPQHKPSTSTATAQPLANRTSFDFQTTSPESSVPAPHPVHTSSHRRNIAIWPLALTPGAAADSRGATATASRGASVAPPEAVAGSHAFTAEPVTQEGLGLRRNSWAGLHQGNVAQPPCRPASDPASPMGHDAPSMHQLWNWGPAATPPWSQDTPGPSAPPPSHAGHDSRPDSTYGSRPPSSLSILSQPGYAQEPVAGALQGSQGDPGPSSTLPYGPNPSVLPAVVRRQLAQQGLQSIHSQMQALSAMMGVSRSVLLYELQRLHVQEQRLWQEVRSSGASHHEGPGADTAWQESEESTLSLSQSLPAGQVHCAPRTQPRQRTDREPLPYTPFADEPSSAPLSMVGQAAAAVYPPTSFQGPETCPPAPEAVSTRVEAGGPAVGSMSQSPGAQQALPAWHAPLQEAAKKLHMDLFAPGGTVLVGPSTDPRDEGPSGSTVWESSVEPEGGSLPIWALEALPPMPADIERDVWGNSKVLMQRLRSVSWTRDESSDSSATSVHRLAERLAVKESSAQEAAAAALPLPSPERAGGQRRAGSGAPAPATGQPMQRETSSTALDSLVRSMLDDLL